jgi:1-acyl-sn-glycerol-3-phosphate acyltransferase
MRTRLFGCYRFLASVALRMIATVDIEDTAVDVDSERGLIIVSNHRSMIDILVGLTIFQHWRITPRLLVKASYFRLPVIGTILRQLRAIPAGRERGSETIREAQAALGAGEIIALAPEGRVPLAAERTQGLVDLRSGVGRLAATRGTPVLALGIANADAVLPPRSWLPRVALRPSRRPTIRVAVTQVPVSPGADPAEVMAEVAAALRHSITRAESTL